MKAFLIDSYIHKEGIVVWVLTEDNVRKAFLFDSHPCFFISEKTSPTPVLAHVKKIAGNGVRFRKEIKKDIIDGDIKVIRAVFRTPYIFRNTVQSIRKSPLAQKHAFYNIELDPVEQFFFSNRLFPFSWCNIQVTENGLSITPLEDPESIFYRIPDLRILYIRPQDIHINPRHIKGLPAICAYEPGEPEACFEPEEYSFIDEYIGRKDPDIIICTHGDGLLMNTFIGCGMKNLNRTHEKTATRKERSFTSYGRTIYKASSVYLKGRIHIDPKNSFFLNEVGLNGLIDLARISGTPLQKAARTSPGTIITSIQSRKAFEQDILIPFHKSMPESFKTARKLIQTDKGGLTYRPEPGFYRNVCELDFFSMYPSIMVNYNLSYETLDCGHSDCRRRLPGIHYRICGKKQGIIPQSLSFILKRRQIYKRFKKESVDEYHTKIFNQRQTALKWLLVVSFGYLGYKNARFGRIESHEATTAIGRELLLHAKEIAESQGYRMLHALTDCIYVSRKGATSEDFAKLRDDINTGINRKFPGVFTDHLGFEIKIEGIFRWIAFLPGKSDGIGVANRFFGLYQDGGFKIRGIDIRRSDSPYFIKEFQSRIFDLLETVENIRDYHDKIPEIETLYFYYQESIMKNTLSDDQLSVRKRLSKSPEDYKVNTDTSCAAGTLAHMGIHINPGEKINLIYVHDPDIKAVPLELFRHYPQAIDTEKYLRLLDSAYQSFIKAI